MSDTCRSCGASIFWAVTANGKRIPLDATPSLVGNMVLRMQAGDDGKEVLDEPHLALSLAARTKLADHGVPFDPDEPRFTSHFATCPQATAWRAKGR